MALVVADRVQETATANTTVSFTLAGAVTGFQSFTVVGNTNTTYYTATDASGNWEVGLGTYSTTGPTLTRTTILSSSNSNAAVTFSGTVNVFVTYPASKAIFSPTGTLAQSTSVFTSGTAATYTAPANTQWVKITVVGAGANGAGAAGQRATGGGAGGVAIKWFAMSASQTLIYTVGAAGSTGGNSTVASGTATLPSTITSNGGGASTATNYASGITQAANGGNAVGGDINMQGGYGGNSWGTSTAITTNVSGKGGDCPGWGVGGQSVAVATTTGQDGTGYGSGGAGGIGSSGGAGRLGVIIFEAY